MNMDITVTMDAVTFEEFREYQKNKALFAEQYRKDVAEIRNTANEICSDILDAINEIEGLITANDEALTHYTIRDEKALARAVAAANEWFA